MRKKGRWSTTTGWPLTDRHEFLHQKVTSKASKCEQNACMRQRLWEQAKQKDKDEWLYPPAHLLKHTLDPWTHLLFCSFLICTFRKLLSSASSHALLLIFDIAMKPKKEKRNKTCVRYLRVYRRHIRTKCCRCNAPGWRCPYPFLWTNQQNGMDHRSIGYRVFYGKSSRGRSLSAEVVEPSTNSIWIFILISSVCRQQRQADYL